MWSIDSGQRLPRRAGRGKEHLLAVAARVIAERGLEETRFSDVAEAAGVSISTLQYLFGARDDLLMAAIARAIQEEQQHLAEIAAQVTDPSTRLAQLTMYALGEDERSARFRRLRVEVYRAGARHAELHTLALEGYEAWLSVLRDSVQEGIEQGLFRRTLSAYNVAPQLLALFEGLATPLLVEYAAIDVGKAQQLAREVIVAVLHVDQPLPEMAS